MTNNLKNVTKNRGHYYLLDTYCVGLVNPEI